MNQNRHAFVHSRRRGAVVVQVAVMTTVILGFGALAIDLGNLYTARTELQRAADAAALAGASAYLTNDGLVGDYTEVTTLAVERSQSFSYVNPTLRDGTILDTNNVTLGTFDFDCPDNGLDTSGQNPFNAVQVLVQRTSGSSNGPVEYLFATVFGLFEGGVGASATAAVDDRFAGFEQRETNRLLIPFTIHADIYAEMLVNGSDDWSYSDGQTDHIGDGVPEILLYPWKLSGQGNSGDPEGAGNFGLLNVGVQNHGVPAIELQIRTGIAPEDLEAEIGTAEITFYDEDGDPVTYEIGGTPGLKAGMEDAIVDRIGDIVGFFIHDGVWGSGANAVYHIVDVRFGRVMYVDLHGSMRSKQLLVQPLAYTGPGVIVNEYAEPSDGQVGLVRLVR